MELTESGSMRGTARIKIIEAGWGSSGYYSEEVLQRDKGVFSKGTQMFLNHATPTEEADRPEGDIERLVGILTSDAEYKDGALYAKAKIYPHYKPLLKYMGEDIGISIRAIGEVSHGEAEGKSGNIIERIASVRSIDFVTRAGAGGKIMELLENKVEKNIEETKVSTDNERIERQERLLQEAQKDNQNLREALLRERTERLLSEARGFIKEMLVESSLPDRTCARLEKELISKVKVSESGIDYDALKGIIRETIQEAMNELQEANPAGVIRGMGSFKLEENYTERLEKAFLNLGLDEKAVKYALGDK